MLNSKKVSTCRPLFTQEDHDAIARVMESGYIGMGPEVEAFETELASYLGISDRSEGGVTCVNTGTSALQIAIQVLNLEPGAEILVPSLTYVASFQAASLAGANPIPCDVQSRTALLDLADCARRLSEKTRAIMPVHYAGNVGDLEAIYRFAERHQLRVIEDAAHAFGSHYQGAPIGSIGDLVCFSFDPIKNITSGEGGAVICRDNATLMQLRTLRNLGITPCTTENGSYDFDVTDPGYRYHMPDLMAAIGRSQLSRFTTTIVPAKKTLKAAYIECLQGIEGVTLLPLEAECVPHIIPVMVAPEKRLRCQQALAAAGFETKVHYKPNHLLTAFSGYAPCPNAESVYTRILTLPSHLGVTRQHIESIAEILANC